MIACLKGGDNCSPPQGRRAGRTGRFSRGSSRVFPFPTFEHQQRRYVRAEFLLDFDRAVAAQPESDDLVISAYAQVADSVVAKNMKRLRQLAPYSLWNGELVQMRLTYKRELPFYVLLLCAFDTTPQEV